MEIILMISLSIVGFLFWCLIRNEQTFGVRKRVLSEIEPSDKLDIKKCYKMLHKYGETTYYDILRKSLFSSMNKIEKEYRKEIGLGRSKLAKNKTKSRKLSIFNFDNSSWAILGMTLIQSINMIVSFFMELTWLYFLSAVVTGIIILVTYEKSRK